MTKRAAVTEQPTLDTPRLVLRPFTLADAADVQRLAGATEVADTTLHVPHPYKDGMAEKWIGGHATEYAAGKSVTYAVTLRGDGTLLGAVGLVITPAHRRADLGYWMDVPSWGQGYMTEAASALVAYAFAEMGLHRVTATHFARNPASGRVMQKLGMRHEGTLRQHYLKGGRYEDAEAYGLLAEEWRQGEGGGGPACPPGRGHT